MTAAADLLVTGGVVRDLPDGTPVGEAVAIRNGRIVAVGSAYDLAFLAGVDTRILELDGETILPGFVDAHTHLRRVGRRATNAELRDTSGPESVASTLRDAGSRGAPGPGGSDWILGFGYDDGAWDRALTADSLPAVEGAPIVAFREDMHGAVLNEVALDRLRATLSGADMERLAVDDRGIVVEGAVGIVEAALEPDRDRTRELLALAQDRAHARGITSVHEMTTGSTEAWAWRALDAAGDLSLRVRTYHRVSDLDALETAGFRSNHGSEHVQLGGVKLFVDGSIGSHTARLTEPYADASHRGEWITHGSALDSLVERGADSGFQVAIHAIGDAAIENAVDAIEGVESPIGRHRIEHLELASDDHLNRLAESDAIASMQPNFHRWADPHGLYRRRLGADRAARMNRLASVAERGIPLAFGSDCMPLDPLAGIEFALRAPTASQRLGVGDAIRAYTLGGAWAAFEADQLGRIAPGYRADLTILDGSPWNVAPAVGDLEVVATIVDGMPVYQTL